MAYLVAFTYESQYLAYFGLPNWVVQVEPTHILMAAAALAIYWPTVYWLLIASPASVAPYHGLIRAALIPGAFVFFLWAFWAGYHGPVKFLVLIGLVTCLILSSLACWYFPLRRFRTGTIAARLQADLEKDYAEMGERAVHVMYSNLKGIGINPSFTRGSILWLTLLFLGVGVLGTQAAAHQKRFLTTTGSPSLLALRRYGDRIVAIEIDSATMLVGPGFHFLEFGDGRLWISRSFKGIKLAPTDTVRTQLPKNGPDPAIR